MDANKLKGMSVNTKPAPARPAPVSQVMQPARPPQPVATRVQVRPPQGQMFTCQPRCVGTASCQRGACQCAVGVVYSPVIGCSAPPSNGRPMMAVPVPVTRIIPQALPGSPCEPGVECTGGSVCSQGICHCPPELVQQGAVCVASADVGLPHRGLPGYFLL